MYCVQSAERCKKCISYNMVGGMMHSTQCRVLDIGLEMNIYLLCKFTYNFLLILKFSFSNKRKYYKKLFIEHIIFWPFLPKKEPKLTKNEENCKNLNWLITFSKIWYLDALPQKKMLQKNCFSISAFFGLFWPKKSQIWPKVKKNGKI